MKVLRDRIMQDGRCLEGGILKVDRFINHQMDPYLMKQIAIEFIRRFADEDINKIVTVEASGIAPAIMLGYLMELPVVFAKKKKPSTMGDFYESTVRSFTKQREYPLTVSREYLTNEDRVLFVDDFLAYGNAGLGIIDLLPSGRSHHRRYGLHHRKGIPARQGSIARSRNQSYRVACHYRVTGG